MRGLVGLLIPFELTLRRRQESRGRLPMPAIEPLLVREQLRLMEDCRQAHVARLEKRSRRVRTGLERDPPGT